MYKNASYQEKYADLNEWLTSIIETVKKDLKNEHLKKDFLFIKKYLASKNPQKVTTEELTEAYRKAIAEESNGNELAEFITARWLLKHSDLYEYFERELSQIAPDFTALEEIDAPAAQKLIAGSVKHFGALPTYIFSVLNSVVFPKETFQHLKKQAKEEHTHRHKAEAVAQEQMSIEKQRAAFETEMARLTDRYEKKISGLEKKYITDTENLKKQIASLQRKMNEKQTVAQ